MRSTLLRYSHNLQSCINNHAIYSSSYIYFKSHRNCTILATSNPSDNIPTIDTNMPITDRLTGGASIRPSSISSFSGVNVINPSRVGKVTDITNTIVTVEGFTSAKPYAMVEFDNGVRGLVLCVDNNGCKIGIIDNGKQNKLLKESDSIRVDKIENFSMQSPSTVVGPGIIGRIVDVFGNDFTYEQNQPYSSAQSAVGTDIENDKYCLPVYNVNLFPNSKYITNWKTYSRTRQRIHTGIKSIDTFYPFAKGLRTAIIGTKQHRKSELAIDILLSFMGHNDATQNMLDS